MIWPCLFEFALLKSITMKSDDFKNDLNFHNFGKINKGSYFEEGAALIFATKSKKLNYEDKDKLNSFIEYWKKLKNNLENKTIMLAGIERSGHAFCIDDIVELRKIDSKDDNKFYFLKIYNLYNIKADFNLMEKDKN